MSYIRFAGLSQNGNILLIHQGEVNFDTLALQKILENRLACPNCGGEIDILIQDRGLQIFYKWRCFLCRTVFENKWQNTLPMLLI